MKFMSETCKLAFILCFLFIGNTAFAAPVIDAKIAHYSIQPRSGYSFNRIEQLSIVLFSHQLSKEYRSPYTLNYRISDKEGKIVEGEKKQIIFSLCTNTLSAVQIVGGCGNYNNISVISLKTRQTRRPTSTKGYKKVGKFWIKEQEADNFPRFEEMEYKLDSFKLTDRSGKEVIQQKN